MSVQIDVPAWVSQWVSAAQWRRRERERGARRGEARGEARGDAARAQRPVAVYSYAAPLDARATFPQIQIDTSQPNNIKPIFRMEELAWLASVGRRGGPGPAWGLQPFLQHPGLLEPDPALLDHDLRGMPWPPPAPAGPAGRGALRAWVFASVLLVLALVLVRVVDKCFALNLLRGRRRSQEWPMPHVHATTRPGISTVLGCGGEEARSAAYGDSLSVDLPPPYFECAAPAPGGSGPGTSAYKQPDYEDPPPAYSDTYVEFSNKNGVPSVLIFSRRRTPLVNRRDIVGTEAVTEGETTAEINAQNTSNEVLDEAHIEVEQSNHTAMNTNNFNQVESEIANVSQPPVSNNATDVDGVAKTSNQTIVDAAGVASVVKDDEVMV